MKRLLKNKKGLKLDQFLIGFILFSVIFFIGTGIIVDLNNNYDEVSMSTTNFKSTYNVLNETEVIGESMKDTTLGAEVDDTETLESVTKGSFSAMRQISNTFSMFSAVLNDIQDVLRFPEPLIQFALAALTIAIVFGLIAFFRGFRQ